MATRCEYCVGTGANLARVFPRADDPCPHCGGTGNARMGARAPKHIGNAAWKEHAKRRKAKELGGNANG